MTGGYRRRAPLAADVRPEINVTPLVDVVLVLLIIFMVVAPRLDQDVQIELPGIFNPDPDKQLPAEPFKVTVPNAGEFRVGNAKYDLDGVVEYLANEHAVDPDRRLVVRADARLEYKDVRGFLNKVQELGFPGVSLTVGERHRTDSAPVGSTQPEGPTSVEGGSATGTSGSGAAAAPTE